ncbi:sodium:solute symporter [Myxococcota bacterium]|nr:sodium:solute symporter [Myxococcota bacterium]
MENSLLATVDIVIVIGFLVLVSVIGFVLSKVASGGMEDYFLGGNKIPWWVLGISTATSNFDMSGTMIIVAMVFSLGYKGFLVEIRGGVGLSLALLLIFLGKWLRRSRVMTSAEWMKLRFGTDTQGKAAHLLSAVANLALSLGMIVYFSKGAGKFLTYYIPIGEVWCTSIMVAIGLFYTLASGLYGVVFTDVIQMILLTLTAVFVTIKAFFIRSDVALPEGLFALNLENPASNGMGQVLLEKDPSQWESIFAFFGICVMMWVVRTVLEGMGGVGGYTDQRFFAARNEREASLLTLEAMILSLFRWTMVAGLVVLGYHLIQSGHSAGAQIATDPEQVLPVVLGQMLPDGIRGLVLAGLIAAAMSTFDSTLNAGASYFVRDIYQDYINPSADARKLMSVSRWATAGLCVAGVGLAALVPNINAIWGLITMGLGAGLFVPLFLRWYWPRFNGYGFAIGTGVGMITGLIANKALGLPLYVSFPVTIGAAGLASVIGSLLTAPTEEKVLINFVTQINPWGFWGRYNEKAKAAGLVTESESQRRVVEKINDMLGVSVSMPFQISMLLAAMAFVFHDWIKFTYFSIVTVLCAVGLYFFWWRNLKSEAECAKDDERFKPLNEAIKAAKSIE